MKRFLTILPATISVIASSMLFSAQPAAAYPTCEQEIRIRCQGYSVGNHPPLDQYYDTYEQCVAAETAAQCGIGLPLSSLDGKLEDTFGARSSARAFAG